MHRATVSTNYPWLPHNTDPINNPTPPEYIGMPIQPLGNRQKFYDDFLEGCKAYYGKYASACQSTEDSRIDMTLRQPESMQNYTDTGFKKIKTPETIWKLVTDFWEHNKDKKQNENWSKGEGETIMILNGHSFYPNSRFFIQETRTPITGLPQLIW